MWIDEPVVLTVESDDTKKVNNTKYNDLNKYNDLTDDLFTEDWELVIE